MAQGSEPSWSRWAAIVGTAGVASALVVLEEALRGVALSPLLVISALGAAIVVGVNLHYLWICLLLPAFSLVVAVPLVEGIWAAGGVLTAAIATRACIALIMVGKWIIADSEPDPNERLKRIELLRIGLPALRFVLALSMLLLDLFQLPIVAILALLPASIVFIRGHAIVAALLACLAALIVGWNGSLAGIVTASLVLALYRMSAVRPRREPFFSRPRRSVRTAVCDRILANGDLIRARTTMSRLLDQKSTDSRIRSAYIDLMEGRYQEALSIGGKPPPNLAPSQIAAINYIFARALSGIGAFSDAEEILSDLLASDLSGTQLAAVRIALGENEFRQGNNCRAESFAYVAVL
jgi:hypothetical protein